MSPVPEVKKKKALYILGTRGVPAAHGGFETFAHRFALYMRDQGWDVTVYCQADAGPPGPVVDEWEGIHRVTFVAGAGAAGTMKFDWKCVMHAKEQRGVMLVLGYNTAIFSALLRFKGLPLLTNMDGIEWKRAKWPWHGRIWLYINEWIGALTSNLLIADHPEIARHLRRRGRKRIATIPYGADSVRSATAAHLGQFGVESGGYLISIGRIEPENNILPMIEAYSKHSTSFDFVCLGRLQPEVNPYHAAVLRAGQGKVKFPGAIYDPEIVQSLRFHAAAYCHGHSVGGTNPSLVEAMGADNPVIAHDNVYNRWVAGADQFYFSDEAGFSSILDEIDNNPVCLTAARAAIRQRYEDALTWEPVHRAYHALCEAALNPSSEHAVTSTKWGS